MRKKILKQIDNKVDSLLIEWVKSLLSDEEQEQVTLKNYKTLLPKEEYILARGTNYLSFYTCRWARQNIKKLIRKGVDLDSITIGDLEWMLKKTRTNRQLNSF